MKLKVKSLQGSTFTIDADSSDMISTVKGKIESSHGHQAASQKIIYSGKILTDTETLQSCGVSEKDFLVLMVSKPKAPKAAAATPAPAAAPATTSAPPASATAATEAAPAANSDTTMTADSTSAAASETTTAAASTAGVAPPTGVTAPASGPPGTSQFLVGSALEEAVNNIVEMGFEKSEVQKAMRASFNNPERAVEYLMTGIPEHLSQPAGSAPGAAAPSATAQPGQTGLSSATTPSAPAPAPQTAAAPPTAPAQTGNTRAGNLFEAAAAQAQGGAQGGAAAGGAGPLSGLQGMEDDGNGRSILDLGNPAMIAQLRQLVQQNPAALNPLVQALAQSNPRLANAMAEDPEAVLNLLESGDVQGEAPAEGIEIPGMDELNPEDRMAVEQIIAMGIPEPKAIEAYLMCGRNVEMAVQYYFENPGDFDN